jgi:hypothetical protein
MAPIAEGLSGLAGKVEHTVVIPSLVSTMKAQLLINSDDVWAKERGGATVTRVLWDGKQYDEPATRRNRPSFPLPADEQAVQHLSIDGTSVLVHVRAGERISFQSNPCSGWLLASQRLDMYESGSAQVRFAAIRLGEEVILAIGGNEKWTITALPDGTISAIVDSPRRRGRARQR